MIPLAPNLDHVGILARWVADVAAMLDVMAGADPREPGSLAAASGDFIHAAAQTARNQRIALIPTVFDERATAETQHAIGAAVAKLASAGARVEAVEVPPSLAEIVANTGRELIAEAAKVHRVSFLHACPHPCPSHRLNGGQIEFKNLAKKE